MHDVLDLSRDGIMGLVADPYIGLVLYREVCAARLLPLSVCMSTILSIHPIRP